VNPLARAHWADLSLDLRIAVFNALIDSRVSMPLFVGGVDDIASFMHLADKDLTEPDYGMLGPSASVAPEASRLRWRHLGSDGKTRFYAFPSGSLFEKEPHVFSERYFRLRAGRRVRVWTTVAADVLSLTMLRDAATTASRTKGLVPLPPMFSGGIVPAPLSTPDATLVASLKALVSSCNAIVDTGLSTRRVLTDNDEDDEDADGPRFVPLAHTRPARFAASVATAVSADTRGPVKRALQLSAQAGMNWLYLTPYPPPLPPPPSVYPLLSNSCDCNSR
jgi:hypothetical protein